MLSFINQNIKTSVLFISLSLNAMTLSAQQVDKDPAHNHQPSEINTNELSSISTASFGKLKNHNMQISPLSQLDSIVTQQNLKQALAADTVLPLINESRAERIKNQSILNKNNSALKTLRSSHYSFAIYDAYTELFEDFDGDGFYQTFSVTFDADLYTHHFDDQALVYADLYLSRNGGPWMHYFTTDTFYIYGDNSDDQYEVYTTLNNGYLTDNYDVLIDLYEVGYSDSVATYSAYDSDNLFALPLESSNFDPDHHQQSTSHGHGGSSSLISLLFIVFTFIIRKSYQWTKVQK